MRGTHLAGLLGLALVVTSMPEAVEAQPRCKDLAADEKVSYSRPSMIFAVSYPKSMNWVMELDETDVKMRTRPPGIIGFRFKHSANPANVEEFDRSVISWTPVFEFDYGDSKVTLYGSPHNQAKSAEYRALLPKGLDLYTLSATLEVGEFGCDEIDRRLDIEASIRTLRPNPEFQ